ncbi:hypothetical protein [Nocardioides daeguensis]|uniref:Uncharacterized protein n=1 Tax=Nocardioides daeguensis TaxID=908359 RepID=A0ABP6WGU1_9ACTN|nr:hypothetical protein [Nocardioides daeguensis]MBV6727922.1 hypothetical protein [Nocardioides daeguensis]MCR1771665.1 hypothetical protein [Nocardioides daeguensis]
MISGLSDATAAQLLHAAENGVQVRRIHEVHQLELLCPGGFAVVTYERNPSTIAQTDEGLLFQIN